MSFALHPHLNPQHHGYHDFDFTTTDAVQGDSAHCSLTKTAAIPMPDPMHIEVTKIFSPERLA